MLNGGQPPCVLCPVLRSRCCTRRTGVKGPAGILGGLTPLRYPYEHRLFGVSLYISASPPGKPSRPCLP